MTQALAPSRRHRTRSEIDYKVSPYLYIAPFFVMFAIVGLFPLVYTFYVSLYDWNLLTGQGDFAGFDNFAKELRDPFFWNALGNTLSIFLWSAIPQLLAAVFIAAVLDQNLRAKTFWRMAVLLPYVVTPVAVALIFSSAFDERYGPLNDLLSTIGIAPVPWQSEALPAHIGIAAMVNWRWTGYNALILLAAMQAVPKELHEAAAIDGAGAFRRFTSVTLPGIRPTIIFVIITMTIGCLQIFAEPRLFNPTVQTPGGEQRQYQTTVLFLWDMAFNRQDFGKASAIAILLFLVIVAIGLINFLLARQIGTATPRVSRAQRRSVTRARATGAASDTASISLNTESRS